MSERCTHRLGALVCDRTTAHDPDAVGGHTYSSASGSSVDDRHTEGGHG
jgi:hypothetical protein